MDKDREVQACAINFSKEEPYGTQEGGELTTNEVRSQVKRHRLVRDLLKQAKAEQSPRKELDIFSQQYATKE